MPGAQAHVVPTSALPAPFNQGLLIDQPAGILQFSGQPATVGGHAPIATLTGSPITNLTVQVGGTTFTNVPSIVDSGGVDGTFPTSLNATPGELIEVFAPGGSTPLYSYTYQGTYSPEPITSGLMNTGNLIFAQNPVYINYGANTTTIY